RIERLAAKGIVTGSERTAQDDGKLGHHTVGDHIHKFGPGADDSRLLGVAPDHETVYILEEEQRHPALVAVHDETRCLVRAIDVDDAAVLKRPLCRAAPLTLVGNDPHRQAAESTISAYQRLPVVRLVFVKRSSVDNTAEHVADVVF